MRSKILQLLLALTVLAGACASSAGAQTVTLRFAMITADSFPYMDGAKKFKELVEARSNGAVKVLLFPGGQLGNEREINEAILEGSIQIGVGAGAMANLAPIYNIVQVPFLIQGQSHMAAIADGPIGAKLAERIEQQAGFKVLAWFSTGDSPIETVKKPIKTPADLAGVKIRVIETPVLVDAMRALGANPTPMAYPEVYTGLKQGVIEWGTPGRSVGRHPESRRSSQVHDGLGSDHLRVRAASCDHERQVLCDALAGASEDHPGGDEGSRRVRAAGVQGQDGGDPQETRE